jgi:hypothetical protein
MIEAMTYLWHEDESVPLETFRGRVNDPFYIYGVIDLRISGEQILSVEQWDLVDQLWAYIVDGACHLARGESFSTFFPDQPLELCFTLSPETDSVTVNLRYGVPERDTKTPAATLARQELVAGIVAAAEPVFKKLLAVAPDNRRGYESVLRRIETLKVSPIG